MTIAGGGVSALAQFALLGTTTIAQTATTTVSQELNVVGDGYFAGDAGTTTLILDTEGASQGSCIQMRGATSTAWFRIYISETNAATGTTGHLKIERGVCQ